MAQELLPILNAAPRENDYRERSGPAPKIQSLLIKPASALCNLDCEYCFYLDRDSDPYRDLEERRMPADVLEQLVDGFMFYSYPMSVFAFQGGEPTLAGLPFFEKLVRLQERHGRPGHSVSNSIQTNAILLDKNWCQLFRSYNWLLGVSLDGPEEIHDTYRWNKARQGTWKKVMSSVELLQKEKVEFNILCVVNKTNVTRAKELYRFFRKIGIEHLQFIPLAEFDGQGAALPFTPSPEEYGRFLLEMFDLWWPERRKVRIRVFDNIAEALAGQVPGNCGMHESCDSYAVLEYNGDVFPCDFFVSKEWKLGNIMSDSWVEIGRRQRRFEFASKKSVPHAECSVCEFAQFCHGGCPKFRHGPNEKFDDLDYYCTAYKMIFARALKPLGDDLRKLFGPTMQPRALGN